MSPSLALACLLALADDGGAAVTAARGRGVTVRSGDVSVALKARLQLRDTLTVDAGTAKNLAGVSELRISLAGEAPRLAWLLHLNAARPDAPIYDAWASYAVGRDLALQVGQQLVPFDRARTMRESALQFVDRPAVVRELGLDRDVGLVLRSDDLGGLDGRLAYRLGVFGGQGSAGASPAAAGPLVVARVEARPFGDFDADREGDLARDPAPRLALGIGAAFNHRAARDRSDAGEPLAVGATDFVHGVVDAHFKARGLSILLQLAARDARVDHLTGAVDGTPTEDWARSAWGGLAQVGLMLGDRDELTARYGQLEPLGATDPALVAGAASRGRELGVGLDHYLDGHAAKVQLDATHAFGATLGEGPLTVRLALDLTL